MRVGICTAISNIFDECTKPKMFAGNVSFICLVISVSQFSHSSNFDRNRSTRTCIKELLLPSFLGNLEKKFTLRIK